MLLTSNPNYCSVCGQSPLLKRPEPITMKKEGAKGQKTGGGGKQPTSTTSNESSSINTFNVVGGDEVDVTWFLGISEAESHPNTGLEGWETIRARAIEKSPESVATILTNLSLEDIGTFIGRMRCSWNNGEAMQDIERFIRLGLLKPVDPNRPKRIRPSDAGEALLEAYREVFGSE
jgi:hypothetical protein